MVFDSPELPLYKQLLEMVAEKEYFVMATNVDGLFRKAGFRTDRLFEVQGDCAYIQSIKGTDSQRFYAEDLMRRMVSE